MSASIGLLNWGGEIVQGKYNQAAGGDSFFIRLSRRPGWNLIPLHQQFAITNQMGPDTTTRR